MIEIAVEFHSKRSCQLVKISFFEIRFIGSVQGSIHPVIGRILLVEEQFVMISDLASSPRLMAPWVEKGGNSALICKLKKRAPKNQESRGFEGRDILISFCLNFRSWEPLPEDQTLRELRVAAGQPAVS